MLGYSTSWGDTIDMVTARILPARIDTSASVLGLYLDDGPGPLRNLNAASYQASTKDLRVSPSGRDSVSFDATFGYSLCVRKTYVFTDTGYVVGVHVTLARASTPVGGRYELRWMRGMPYTETGARNTDFNETRGLLNLGGSRVEVHPKGEDLKREARPDQVEYVASCTKYFVAALINEGDSSGAFADAVKLPQYITDPTGQKHDYGAVHVGLVRKLPVARAEVKGVYGLYLGPKRFASLQAAGLDQTLYLGWQFTRAVGKLLLQFFLWLHGFFPNWGVVIILFTIALKVLTYPFSAAQLRSVRSMQALQPHLKELKEKHADDPQRLNLETLKLYRQHKVNPLGGCVPILLQMPIFVALWAVLNNAMELRKAPFIWWIHDLSQPDPTWILLLLMCGSMVWQQKMTITDPTQKFMIYLTPAMFLFLFHNMPSGWVLYFLIFNGLSIAQQYGVIWWGKRAAENTVSLGTSWKAK